jgi:hypothetical protein
MGNEVGVGRRPFQLGQDERGAHAASVRPRQRVGILVGVAVLDGMTLARLANAQAPDAASAPSPTENGARGETTADTAGASVEGPIEDNSFLVEEAYNQERAVIQYISMFMRSPQDGRWV